MNAFKRLLPVIAVLAGCYVDLDPKDSRSGFRLYGGVGAADLNGDGRTDLALAFSAIAGPPPHPGAALILLHDSGPAGQFLPGVEAPGGRNAEGLAIADLNGDGKPDLAIASHGAGPATVLLQGAVGGGGYLGPVNYPTGGRPQDIAVADVNGDGRPDLVVAAEFHLAILIQDLAAPGTFLPARTIDTRAGAVAVGDLNADTLPDLAVTDSSANSVKILLHDAAQRGSFLAPVSYDAGAQPMSVALEDLNLDGRPDLAVGNFGSPYDPATASLSILIQDPLAPGTFLAAVGYATGHRTQAVAIGDLNGDGRPDVAVANGGSFSVGGTLSVHLQDPAMPGRFLVEQNYSAGIVPADIAIADLNGDGRADIVMADEGAAIYLQDAARPGTFRFAGTIQ